MEQEKITDFLEENIFFLLENKEGKNILSLAR